MSSDGSLSPYVLGNTDSEHERLIRQAARLAPCTERFFRAAGIGPGQRILELGSGVGDVAMLAARLVGPSGEVVGVERDARSIVRARARVDAAGLRNVRFTQRDVAEIASDQRFDAAVGRFILMFVPDPLGVVRSLGRLVRPGGTIAFHEPSWVSSLLLSERLPLWSRCITLVRDTIACSGANTEMGFALHRIFQQAGLSEPTLQMEIPLASDAEFTGGMVELLRTLLPQLPRRDPALAALGGIESLAERIAAEVAAANAVVPWMGMVGVHARTALE